MPGDMPLIIYFQIILSILSFQIAQLFFYILIEHFDKNLCSMHCILCSAVQPSLYLYIQCIQSIFQADRLAFREPQNLCAAGLYVKVPVQPFIGKLVIDAVFLQDFDIIAAPCAQDKVFSAKPPEIGYGFPKAHSGVQIRRLYSGFPYNDGTQLPIYNRLDQPGKRLGNLQAFTHLGSADLNDFKGADGIGPEPAVGIVQFWLRLAEFCVVYNIVHVILPYMLNEYHQGWLQQTAA